MSGNGADFIKGRNGASCSGRIKRDVMAPYLRPDDTHVVGYAAEEEDRFLDWLDFSKVNAIAPLIELGLMKADCLAIVERAGIALPIPYLQGFDNANCLNCCKGGMRYWLRILQFYPERFWRSAAIQEKIGPNARFLAFRGGPRKGERMWLRELAEMADVIDISGDDEPEISCSFFCQMAEDDIRTGEAAE